MAISNAAQFGLLLWKNWLLQKRRIVVTTFQILVPAVVAFILLLIRIAVVTPNCDSSEVLTTPTILNNSETSTTSMNWNTSETKICTPTIRESFDASPTLPRSLDPNKMTGSPQWILAYSPSTSNAAERMAQNITQMLDVMPIGMLLMFTFIVGLLLLSLNHKR